MAVLHSMNRRAALGLIAGAVGLPASMACAAPVSAKRTGLGLVVYCSRIRRDTLRGRDKDFDLYAPLSFLHHCVELGAGGMQCPLGVLNAAGVQVLKSFAENNGLFVEAIVRPPKDESDVDRFDVELQTAAAVGALAVRTTIIPGRRYEYFDSLEMFNEFAARGRRMLELAAPVAEKHRIPIAVENHKDQRDDERIALFEHIDSEYVGACVDTGNSFALLEDPIQTDRDFAPWAHSVHLKDQALQLYDEGFLLADIPLGQGGLDLKCMVAILKKAKPDINFSLELITRDPLKVPCLTEKYWSTFPTLPGRDLAGTLRYVRDHTSENLQYVSRMSPDERLAREDANVRESLNYARSELGLAPG